MWLPDEVIFEQIVIHLPLTDVVNCLCVSKQWKVSNDNINNNSNNNNNNNNSNNNNDLIISVSFYKHFAFLIVIKGNYIYI